MDPSPNVDALDRLAHRHEWFFDTFLTSSEMVKVRDGKVAGELLVKALHKVDAARPEGPLLNLVAEYQRSRRLSK